MKLSVREIPAGSWWKEEVKGEILAVIKVIDGDGPMKGTLVCTQPENCPCKGTLEPCRITMDLREDAPKTATLFCAMSRGTNLKVEWKVVE